MHMNQMGSLSLHTVQQQKWVFLVILKSIKRPPKQMPLHGLSQKGCIMGSLTHMKAQEMS